MEEKAIENLGTVWSIMLGQTEFWAAIVGAIVGAVVGGSIAYMVQVRALREGRKQRGEDHNRLQQALGHALLFKMVRIHSDFYGLHRHFEDCFAEIGPRCRRRRFFAPDQPERAWHSACLIVSKVLPFQPAKGG